MLTCARSAARILLPRTSARGSGRARLRSSWNRLVPRHPGRIQKRKLLPRSKMRPRSSATNRPRAAPTMSIPPYWTPTRMAVCSKRCRPPRRRPVLSICAAKSAVYCSLSRSTTSHGRCSQRRRNSFAILDLLSGRSMHIKKQRLLTPGPTPLYPKALYAMMGSDIHHRTQDFSNVYRAVLADLKEVFGTANDVLPLVASGTGAMEASVSNLFSAGDRVIVCSAGKFGERWAEIAKAYGLDAVVLQAEYGDVVTPDRVGEALKANPGTRGVFVQD